MMKVYLSEKIHENAVALLGEHFEVVQGTSTAEDEIIRQAQGCSAILVRSASITAKIMNAIPTLRIVAKHGIGVDNIDVDAATKKEILVVNAPLSNINAVAEHTVTLLLSLSKHLVRMDRITRDGQFSRRNAFPTVELSGCTVGLLGLGKIARLVAKKLSGFGMNLIGSDPFVTQEDVAELGITVVTNEELYARSDFLCVHAPLIPSTRHMLGADEFRAMKPTAFVINAARGPVIDEPALIEALRAGEIAGAGLDVFEAEPPEPDNPLFTMDNVIVSPHNAALSDGALLAMAMDSATGIVEYLTKQPVSYPVNPTVLKH